MIEISVISLSLFSKYLNTIGHFGKKCIHKSINGDRRGRDRMVVGFTTTYAISPYYH